jgi:hypothetical protein
MLTVLMPITRSWSREAVIGAISASDIPRQRALLVFDAPVPWEPWRDAFCGAGFAMVTCHRTGNPDPPAERIARRARHRALRRLTQALVPNGPLLCLEDDTIVPPDVYARLSAAGANATAVQVARHADRRVGVFRCGVSVGPRAGVQAIDACGHYCLLTTGEAYKAAAIPDDGAVDAGHTAQIRPLVVDWDCHCGHLLENGDILWP